MGRGRSAGLDTKNILFNTQIGAELRKPSPSLYSYKKQDPKLDSKTIAQACKRIFEIVNLEDDSEIVKKIGAEDFHGWLATLDTAANHLESESLNGFEIKEDDSELLKLKDLYEDEMYYYDGILEIGQLIRPLFWGADAKVFGLKKDFLQLGDNQYNREFINQFFGRFWEDGEYVEIGGAYAQESLQKLHKAFDMGATHNENTIESLHQQGYLKFHPDNSKRFQDLTKDDSVELTETTKVLQKYM